MHSFHLNSKDTSATELDLLPRHTRPADILAPNSFECSTKRTINIYESYHLFPVSKHY